MVEPRTAVDGEMRFQRGYRDKLSFYACALEDAHASLQVGKVRGRGKESLVAVHTAAPLHESLNKRHWSLPR